MNSVDEAFTNTQVAPDLPLPTLYGWDVPGIKIGGYYVANDNSIGMTIPMLSTPLSSSVSYCWVDGSAGGTTKTVNVGVITPWGPSKTLFGDFTVTKPTVEPTATLEPYANGTNDTGYLPAGKGSKGINMYKGAFKSTPLTTQVMIVFQGVPPGGDMETVPGITFNASPVNVDDDFQFAWVQVINNVSVVETLTDSRGQPARNPPPLADIHSPWNTLDNWFPYSSDYYEADDSPRWVPPSNSTYDIMNLPLGLRYTLSYSFCLVNRIHG